MAIRRLTDSYRFPGFKPCERILGVFGDSKARIVRLERTGKKLSAAAVVQHTTVIMIARKGAFAICHQEILESISSLTLGALPAKPVAV